MNESAYKLFSNGVNVLENAEFDKSSEDFGIWFQELQGATFHPSLRIADLRDRGAGRGIVATADIAEDEVLFATPRKYVLTVENSTLAQTSPDFFDRADQLLAEAQASADDDDASPLELDPWLKLIITLVYEFLHLNTSPWRPYLDVLPKTFETPMFWDERELTELQASPLLRRIGRHSAEEAFRKLLLPILHKNADLFFDAIEQQPTDDRLIALMHRIGSTIMAYAFDLEKDDEDEQDNEDGWTEDREGQVLGMVPMADMLNADAEFNAHLNHGEDSLTMVALRPIKAGEEVLNYYGPLPSSDLLRRYGYFSEKHTVHDVAEVEWALVIKATVNHLGMSELEMKQAMEHLDSEDLADAFVFEGPSIEPDSNGMLPTMRSDLIVQYPEDLHEQLSSLLSVIRKKIRPSMEKDRRTELEIAAMAIHAKIEQYGTRLDADQRLLAQRKASGRQLMALKVRIGEKMILKAAEEGLRAKIASLAAQEQPAAKRRKMR